MENGGLSYTTAGKFLSDLKEGFKKRDDETMKVEKLKKVEQRSRIIKKFVQEFRRAVRESGYKERLLVEEFK